MKTTTATLTDASVLSDPLEYKKVMEHSSVAFIMGIDGHTILANESAAHLFGYSREEFLGMRRNDLFVNDEHYFNALEKRAGGISNVGELTAKRKDGSTFMCQVYSTLFIDKDGVAKSSTVVIDISKHKELERQAMLAQLLTDNIEETFLLIDKSFKIITYTRSAKNDIKKILNKEVNVGDNILDITTDHKNQSLKQFFSESFEGKTTFFYTHHKLNDGRVFYYENRIKPVCNEQNEIFASMLTAFNITDRVKAEAALEQTEQRWRFALEGSNQGVWDWDIRSGKTYYSPTWKKLLGYNEDDVIEGIEAWKKLLHPDDQEKMLVEIDQYFNSQNPSREIIQRLRTKNGDYKWILARGMIISYDETGAPLRMIGTHTDITEQKNIQEGYKQLFYGHPLPMWIYDRNTLQVEEVNDAALKEYGYSRAEFLSLTIEDIRPKEDLNILHKYIGQINPDETAKYIVRHLKKDGEIIHVEVVGNNLDYNGKKCRMISANNVTATVKSEQELRKSNERFQHAATATSDAIWEWDIESDSVYLSNTYTDILGHAITLPHRKFALWYELIHPNDKEEVVSGFKKAFYDKEETKWEKEYRYKKADGTYVFVLDRAIILRDDSGKAVKLIGAIKNISKRKTAEAELKKSNERFELAGKATSDAIWDWDIINNTIHWGESFYTNFGHQTNIDIEGWAELILDADRVRVKNSLNHALFSTEKKHWSEEYQFKDVNGVCRYVLDRGFIVRDENKKPLRMIGAIQDITERKVKQQELERSNERFELASLATSDIVWDWNLETKTIEFADNYTKTFGINLPADKKLHIEECFARIHADDRRRAAGSIYASVNNPKTNKIEEEFRYQKQDGTYAFIMYRAYIIRDEEGKAIRVIGALSDISDKKNQQELLAFELRVFETSAIPNISFTNVLKTFLQGFEYIHHGMQAVLLLVNEEQRSIVATRNFFAQQDGLKECISRHAYKTSRNVHNKKHFMVADLSAEEWKPCHELFQEQGWKLCWIIPINHSDGMELGYFTIFLNRSEVPSENQVNTFIRLRNLLRILIVNNQSLMQVQISNERYDMMLQATHDMIWDWNLETGNFYRNEEGLRKVYGVGENQSIQNIYKWMERIHPDDYHHVESIINSILHSVELDKFEIEYRFRRDDQTYSHVYDRGIIIKNANGKAVRLIGAAQDISERKRLEEQLVKKELERQKAINQATIETQEQERREIGKELHDNVNQILTTTKLYLELSLSNQGIKDDLISKSSANINYVINEIRQLSRSLMDPSIGDLGLVDSLNDLIESINITQRLSVSLKADSMLDDLIQANQKLSVFRIVQEALSNTIKYAQASQATISLKRENDIIELIIKDNGQGFDLNQVKKGAGLKNIQNRTYLMNGKVAIETGAMKGCSIKIQFPINQSN